MNWTALFRITAATSANESCWNELNIKADGFGTCDPAKNESCAAQYVLIFSFNVPFLLFQFTDFVFLCACKK